MSSPDPTGPAPSSVPPADGSSAVGAGAAAAGEGATAATAAPPAVVVRPRRLLVVSWVGAIVLVVLFAVVAALLPQTPTGVHFRLADQIAVLMIGLIMAGLMLLVARPRVRADAAGIEVRNILVTRRMAWSEVRRVAFPDGASWARLDLPDDEYLAVLAVQAVDGQRAVEAMRALRALHAASRS